MVRRISLLALGLAALAGQASAQVVTVTSPGVKTVVAGDQSDSFAYDTWLRDNVRTGSSVGVSGTYARSGNGSAYMSGSSSLSKADMEYYFGGSVLSAFRLGDLSALSYDFYRNSSSTVAAHLAPSLRLYVDEDGDLNTTGDRSSLIYEPVYNSMAVATDTWNTALIGMNTNLWRRMYSPGFTVEDYAVTLGMYESVGGVTTNGRTISGNSLVLGLSSGIGSGWTGTYDGAIDNIRVVEGNRDVTFNFETEVDPTPEPASLVLMGTGLLAIGGVVRKRRK